MKKTVMFGGTFNPIHKGHVEMIRALSQREEVDRIIVVPTNVPPHKEKAEAFASPADRLIMCDIAIKGIKRVYVCDIEFSRPGKSYTIDTLTQFKEMYGDVAIMIGADMLTTFDEWKDYEKILEMADIYAVRRPGIDNDLFDKAVERYSKKTNVIVLDLETPDISSTQLREMLKTRQVGDYVSKYVLKYIDEKELFL